MTPTSRPLPSVLAAAIDLALVLAFCAIGRAAHSEAVFAPGYLVTAWPFAAGLALGWVVVGLLRRPAAGVAAGTVVFVATVAGGMLLRAASGQGTAAAFVIVAIITLALFLLGWRAVALVTRRVSRSA